MELANLFSMLVVVVTKYIEIALKSRREFDINDSSTFETFHVFVSIEEINTISLAICSFFYPFRLIQLLAHFQILDMGKTVINTMCRTAPGLTVYALAVIIMFLSWAQGIHILLAPYYHEFETYAQSLFNMIASDF